MPKPTGSCQWHANVTALEEEKRLSFQVARTVTKLLLLVSPWYICLLFIALVINYRLPQSMDN